MATSGALVSHEALKHKARYYKSELMMKMFGVSASAAVGFGTASSNAISAMSHVPSYSNLAGIGYGAKLANGFSVEGEEAVRVYVRTKLPKYALSQGELIPSHVDGLTTDVIPVGDIVPRRQSVRCGVSIGHPSVTAGTLGCLVRKPNENENYVLSNNHILADCDDASLGDPILEPGRDDGGDPNDPIAELSDFEPITKSGPRTMDAAIGRVLDINSVTPEILSIGRVVNPPMPASLYQSVRKCGRTTLHTVGIVTGIDEDVRVRYGKVFVNFEGQLSIEGFKVPFSGGGDSGSLVVDAVSRRAVGLLFAGGLNGIDFANEIQPVLDRFGVEIV